jgi:hypothetical protein
MVAMSQSLELNRLEIPSKATADRRYRSSRAAYDRILDRTGAAGRQKASDALAAAVRNHPTLAQDQRRIQAHRIRLSRRGEGLAVAGALTIIGLVAALCITAAPLASQTTGIVVGAVGLAGFRLALVDGRAFLTLQIFLQVVAGFVLLGLGSSGADMALPVAVSLMGWAALGLRTIQLSAHRRLDIDEVELMLAAEGRQTVWAVREDMHRRVAAAI